MIYRVAEFIFFNNCRSYIFQIFSTSLVRLWIIAIFLAITQHYYKRKTEVRYNNYYL